MYEGLIGKTLNTGDEKYFSKWIIERINPSNIEDILKLDIFKEHPNLLTPSVFNSTAEEIEKIVKLEVFKERPELLTPLAFYRTPEEIEKILNLEIFKEHPELLTPVIFTNNQIEIAKSYLTYDYFKLADLITSGHLVIKKEEIYSKAIFLEDISNALTVKTSKGKIKVNPIFIMSNKIMIESYGVSKKDLKRKYDYHKSDVKPIVETRAKMLIK